MSMFEIYDGRPALYQWDLNRQLIVRDEKCKEVHFFNGTTEKALVCEVKDLSDSRVVDVPNLLLQTNRNITVYSYIKAQDGAYTKRAKLFEVLSRPKPDDYVYTETEVKSWDALDARIKALEGEGLADAVAAYLEENPVEAGATEEEAAQIQKNKEDIEKLQEDKLDAAKLPEAVNGALAQAKASGAFDGADGHTPVKGVDYFTEADKQEIAQQAAGLVEVPEGGSDYVLPVGGETLGGVKNGGNVTINADGTMDAPMGGGGSNQPLTFTGAVSAIYDGSKAVLVEIPTGGGSGAVSSAEWNTICEGKLAEAVGAIVIDSAADGTQLSSLNVNELLIFGRVKLSADSKLRFEHNGLWTSGNYVNASGNYGAWVAPFCVYQRKFQGGIITEISISAEHMALHAPNNNTIGYPIRSFEIHVETDGVTFALDNTYVNAYYR